LIKLLAIVDSNTLLEEDINEPKLKVFEPEFDVVNSLEDVYTLVSKNDDPLDNEGYVVVDDKFNRIKFKNPKYDALSFTPYNVDDFKSLKNYSEAIALLASVLDYYCVVCNPLPGYGPPTNSCVSVQVGDVPSYIPELRCSITKVISCGDCLGYIDDTEQLSIQSTQACSTSWNPKASNVHKDENITSLVNDFVSFIRWFNNKYLEYKSTGNVIVKELLVSIWSYAFEELSKGKSISEIINSSYEVDQVKALELYHLIVQDN
jgi:hypothetical protein